jgi:predicted DNA-binding transcriptional regulator YafY
MADTDIKRIARLTAILVQLQAGRMVTATALAARFGISVRTIYRDIRTLEQAGVPILTEEGKGYYLMDGYRLPPVMFTEEQANALILAGQLVQRNSDASLVEHYMAATDKIKAVLRYPEKEKAHLLTERTTYTENETRIRTSNILSLLQTALTNYFVTQIDYINAQNETTQRLIEPFAVVSTTNNWLLIAWCRRRNEFRYFRVDRILKVQVLSEKFAAHNMTLQQFFDKHP